MDETTLEKLIAHQAHYFTFAARLEQTPNAWFLHGPTIPDYRDANHALRLRTDVANGMGADAVVDMVFTFYRERSLPPVADIDFVAEHQGIGTALRRRGLMPVTYWMRLMRHEGSREQQKSAPIAANIEIRRVPTETGQGEAQEWIDVENSDAEDYEDAAMWRQVARAEARSPDCRLYVAYFDGQPAGVADLFVFDDWGRIDSVVTHPDFRRRGVATTLIAHIVADSLALGNTETYLLVEPDSEAERIYRRLGFEEWAVHPFRRHIAR